MLITINLHQCICLYAFNFIKVYLYLCRIHLLLYLICKIIYNWTVKSLSVGYSCNTTHIIYRSYNLSGYLLLLIVNFMISSGTNGVKYPGQVDHQHWLTGENNNKILPSFQLICGLQMKHRLLSFNLWFISLASFYHE